MRVSLNFIKEFLEVGVSPQKLAALLTMAGMEVEHLEKAGGDWVFHIEVTTNRYDWLSVLGVAREVAAISGKNLKVKYPAVLKKPFLKEKDIVIENKQDCPYYIGRVLKGVKTGRSRKKLKELILNCGLAPVNNVVDITNYCMLKWGNPLHAFDEDKIEGNIYIRRAKKGEEFIGIDDKQRVLDKENLVIADSKKVIALAGIMGAKNTEVDDNTKNIFLEAAIFSPLTIRRSRRAIGLDTESSYRFERQVNPDNLEFASSEAEQLIKKEAKGIFCGYKQAGEKPRISRKKITIFFKHLNSYLGTAFPKQKAKTILRSLDFCIKSESGDKIQVLSPAGRFDVKQEVDVYEELIRIHGYENIPISIPFLTPLKKDFLADCKKDIYHFKNELAAYAALLKFKEIITYSMEGQERLMETADKDSIKILNPLRKQENALRTNLLTGMVGSIKYNLNRNQSSLYFFEIADTYHKNKEEFIELPTLALGISVRDGNIQGFFELKKAVEQILAYLNINAFEFKEESLNNFTNSLTLVVKNKTVGFLGKLDESRRKDFGLREDLLFAQLDLLSLIKVKQKKKYETFSPYPVIFRDISIFLRKDVKFKTIAQIIRSTSSYLSGLNIVDIYQGKDVPSGFRAFTLRIFYQSKDKTLTAQEVDSFHNNARENLNRQEGIIVR